MSAKEFRSPRFSNASRMKRSSGWRLKNPAGRSRSAWASMSGTEMRCPLIALLPTAQTSRPNRPAA